MQFRRLLAVRHNLLRLTCRTATQRKIPALTQERYPVQRGDYSCLESKDVKFFESIVGADNAMQEDLQGYNVDFLQSVRGDSQLVLKPGCTEEVSAILKYCNERKLAVCPQSGNTGLVGGSVPVFDEIVLSLKRMNKVISIDDLTGIITTEAGCILDNLSTEAKKKGLLVPLDLGAKQSCLIGGNLATNAGGLRVLRYGNLHGSVLGVEAVLANGKVLDLMSNFKKDNTGYHLKHLFIGGEGTLGIITKASLLCPPEPQAQHVAFLGLNSFDDVLKTFLNAKRFLGEILSSCEMLDAETLRASIKYYDLNSPVDGYPFYMLIETSGSNAEHDMEKFNDFLEHGMAQGQIMDGTITGEVGKMLEIWKLRELAPVGLISNTFSFCYDVSVPLREFYNFVDVMKERVRDLGLLVAGFGHLGDFNLHVIISCPEFTQESYKRVEPFIYELTGKLQGSVSAEHGIGFLKTKYLKYSKHPEAVAMMHELKHLLDPNRILNPYKVLN